jgi:hypothetical protein
MATLRLYGIKPHTYNKFPLQKKIPRCLQRGFFIFWVKEFKKRSGVLDEAAKQAIDYCIRNNILKDILEKHSSELFNMLLT